MKQNIKNKLGILLLFQCLLYEGNNLQDSFQTKDCGIKWNSTIILNLRLRGGAFSVRNPNGLASFKDAVNGKVFTFVD